MFKISGAYSDDFSVIVDKLNESAKKLENYTIDGDTYGTLSESLDGIKTIITDIEGCLLELNHNVSERMIYINASLL